MDRSKSWFSRRWVKVLLWVIAVLILVVVLVCSYLWSKLDMIEFSDEVDFVFSNEEFDEYVVDMGDMEISETAPDIPDVEIQQDDSVRNILILGTDERSTDFHYNARSDSMILVSINTELQTVKLVSFERAIGVPILEGKYEGQYDLLTHIFRWGGSELVVKTIEHCFKIDIDSYVRVNFNSVKNIVDAVGGIEMELSASEAGALNGDVHGGASIFSAGSNHLDGKAALAFARLRRIDSDWQRVERQRKVILAVVDALKNATLIELNNLADEVLPMIQTDLTKLDIVELVLYAPNFIRSEFDQMTIPKEGTYGGMKIRTPGGAFAVDYEINNDLLHRFLYEGASSEELLAE